MANGWKIIAWIFIIISVAEGGLIYYSYSIGTEWIEHENLCSTNLCTGDSYYYDQTTDICSCVEDDYITQEYLLKDDNVVKIFDVKEDGQEATNYYR